MVREMDSISMSIRMIKLVFSGLTIRKTEKLIFQLDKYLLKVEKEEPEEKSCDCGFIYSFRSIMFNNFIIISFTLIILIKFSTP